MTTAPHPRYVYANFTSGAVNYGNYVIDFATRYLLRERLPEPAAEFDSFAGRCPEGAFDFVLVPGCTMITAGQNPGLEAAVPGRPPMYCLAGSLWGPLPSPGLLLGSRVLRRGRVAAPDLRVAGLMQGTCGARDPFTFTTLQKAGMPTAYVGCPTLHLPTDGIADDGFLLVSLGRHNVRRQVAAARRLAKQIPVVGICHERGDEERLRAAGWQLPLVSFRGDVELYLSYFKRAHAVVTGRLHGALPALAYGKPVFYHGTRDTRTTLLDDLGVPIRDLGEMARGLELARPDHNRLLVDAFRARWDALVGEIVARHAMPARGGPERPHDSRRSAASV